MYWEDMKRGFAEVESVSKQSSDELYYYAEKCREQLYELLGEEGAILLEKYLCCLELIEKKSDFKNKRRLT